MMIACKMSEKHSGLPQTISARLEKLLNRYNLPSSYQLRVDDLMQVLKMDKKRTAASIDYILLEDKENALLYLQKKRELRLEPEDRQNTEDGIKQLEKELGR